jgi:hypothetical protein
VSKEINNYKSTTMRNLFLFLFTVVLFLAPISAQNRTTQQVESLPNEKSKSDSILMELQIIRGIQQDAKKKIDSIRTARINHTTMPEKKTEEDLLNEYEAMTQIADNTRQNWLKDDWNVYGSLTFALAAIAFIISVLSYLYTKRTYFAQIKTESNTKKLSQEAQRHLLNELLRHLYRNFVITYTMRTKMKDIKYKGYPSEEHFEKLKIPMENIHLEAFYGEDEKFQFMHVLYLNLRNYNEEVEVALKHIIDPVIKKQTKDEDFDTLEFKVSFLTEKIIDTIYEVWGENAEYKNDMRKAMNLSLSGKTNATKNIDVPNSDKFSALTLDALKNTSYTRLYSESELEKVLEIFNHDVHEERKKNERGAWKVRMIKF